MTITIEEKDYSILKNDLQKLANENYELKEQLKELEEKELIKKAERLAKILCQNYIEAIFEKLGFDNDNIVGLNFGTNLEAYLGKEWYKHRDKIDVEISATITNKFKTAFIAIGVDFTKIENKNEFSFELK